MELSEWESTGRALLDHRWIFAKTMPHNPHWYTLRREWETDEDFLSVVRFIRKHGYGEIYQNRPYTMLNINEYKYWTMGSPLKETILINRKLNGKLTSYDEIAEVYDQLFQDEGSLHENEEIISMLSPVAGKVLDIGCGSGLFLDYLQPDEYLGIDPSRKMLDRLSLKHPAYTNRILQTKLETFLGGRFDLIFSLFGSASYIEPYALQWIPQMLVPGGRYFIMIYKPDYTPLTYLKTGKMFTHFNHDPSLLPGQVQEFGNFYILTGTG